MTTHAVKAYPPTRAEYERLLSILEQIRTVRNLQKQYFATKDKSVLIESKKAEEKLDRLTSNQAALEL